MIFKNKSDYIDYRLKKAEEAYHDAVLLAERGRWNSVINRLYYSCFYAVNALLLKIDVESYTHEGSRTQFGINFIKSGIIEKKFGKIYSKLADLRQKGDYGDFFDYGEDTVVPLLDVVRNFIDEIKKNVHKN